MTDTQVQTERVAQADAEREVATRRYETLASVLCLVALCALVAAVTAVAVGASASRELSAVAMLVNLMFVVGLYVSVGNSGVFSFGHAIFMTVGAYVAGQSDALTGGTSGISGIPGTTVWTTLVWALIFIGLAWAFQRTGACSRLRATREDEFGAVIVSICGAMFAQTQQAIDPSAFYLKITLLTTAMLVVGGMQSLTGAVVGTIVLS